jgi:hypothetical protein
MRTKQWLRGLKRDGGIGPSRLHLTAHPLPRFSSLADFSSFGDLPNSVVGGVEAGPDRPDPLALPVTKPRITGPG